MPDKPELASEFVDPTAINDARTECERKSEPNTSFHGISAKALMAAEFDPIKYVVPNFVVEGLTIFAGAPKLGKSWAVLGWAVAVASGGLAFESIPCQSGDVLYLALEDNARRLQSRLKQMLSFDPPERLTFFTEWPGLDGACIEELENWLNSVPDPRLVIIDVFARIRGTNSRQETTYDSDYRFASQLQELALRYSVGIVLVHHTRKQDAEDPFDSVSGTRGLTGAADSVLVLKRDPAAGRAILYGRGRDLPEIESIVQLNDQTGIWKIIGSKGDVAKTDQRQAILDALRSSPMPLSPIAIIEKTGGNSTNVRRTLTRMASNGELMKPTRGLYACLNGPIVSI